MSILFRAAGLAALCCVAACSPTFNWREWPVQGTPLKAMMPCKPDAATRQVPMLGATPVALHMLSCETGGQRFALAWADVGQAAQVPAALSAWRSASLQSLKLAGRTAEDPALAWTVKVAGDPKAQGMQVKGLDAKGQAVDSRTAYFSRGSQVYQAAVYGARLDAQAVEAFFGGLVLTTP